MPMRCYFLTRQVAVKFWPVYKSRLIFWTDFEDLKGRLIHRKIRYISGSAKPIKTVETVHRTLALRRQNF